MAKQKPFRCQNPACSTDHAGRLIFDFWAEKPFCPKCGTDAKQFPHVVIELTVTHFDPPTHLEGRGQRIKACDGKPYSNGQAATGNPSVVNCRECMATDAWKKAAEEHGIEVVTPLENLPQAIEAGVAQVLELKAKVESPSAELPEIVDATV